MIDYLDAIIRPLLIESDALIITESQDDIGTLLSIRVSRKDMGCIIGKDGSTSKSIKHLVHVLGAQKQMRVSVKFEEPQGGRITVAYTSAPTYKQQHINNNYGK